MEFTEKEQTEFMMYFAGIVAMSRWHPGATFDKEKGKYAAGFTPSLEECAIEAIEMIAMRKKMMV